MKLKMFVLNYQRLLNSAQNVCILAIYFFQIFHQPARGEQPHYELIFLCVICTAQYMMYKVCLGWYTTPIGAKCIMYMYIIKWNSLNPWRCLACFFHRISKQIFCVEYRYLCYFWKCIFNLSDKITKYVYIYFPLSC